MVLPGADLEECKKIAEDIRAEIKDTPFKANGIAINTSMSFGCIKYDINKTIEENIAVADDNLFTAKDSGRNQVYG